MTIMKNVETKMNPQDENEKENIEQTKGSLPSTVPPEHQREQEEKLVKDLIDTEGKITALEITVKNYIKKYPHLQRIKTRKYSTPVLNFHISFLKINGGKKQNKHKTQFQELYAKVQD